VLAKSNQNSSIATASGEVRTGPRCGKGERTAMNQQRRSYAALLILRVAAGCSARGPLHPFTGQPSLDSAKIHGTKLFK
jgi:hypothetical protein